VEELHRRSPVSASDDKTLRVSQFQYGYDDAGQVVTMDTVDGR
jgi:hypothetical protein